PDIIVGIESATGPQVLIYESTTGGLQVAPEVIALPERASAFALGHLTGVAYEDLAIAAGNVLLILEGTEPNHKNHVAPEEPQHKIDAVKFSSPISSLVIGDFASAERQRAAVMTSDGTIHFVSRGRKGLIVEASGAGTTPYATSMVRARVGTGSGDDLVILSSSSPELEILSSKPLIQEPADTATVQGGTSSAISIPSSASGSADSSNGRVAEKDAPSKIERRSFAKLPP